MSEDIKKILDALDKIIKPIATSVSVILDDHKIRSVSRIPKEIKNSIDAGIGLYEKYFKEKKTA